MNSQYKYLLLYAAIFLATTNCLGQSKEGKSIKNILIGDTWLINQILSDGRPIDMTDYRKMCMRFTKDSVEKVAENMSDRLTLAYWIKGKMLYGSDDGRLILEQKILKITPNELHVQNREWDGDYSKTIYVFKRP